MTKIRYTLFLLIFMTAHAGESSRIYTLKSVLLEQFSRFIEWPEGTFGSKEFVIGVSGHPELLGALANVYAKHPIKNMSVRLVSVDKAEHMDECHIVVVGELAREKIPLFVKHVEGKGILLVGDAMGFGDLGVHLNIFEQNNRLRFEANEQSLRKSLLTISFKLLQVARLVGGE